MNADNSNQHDSSQDFIVDLSKSRREILETSVVSKGVDSEGLKKINQYTILKELDRGTQGKVKLASNSQGKLFAIKVANKKKLRKTLLNVKNSTYTQLEREIAILKKLDHPHVVKLIEVIDDIQNDKLYLVMEYVKLGHIFSAKHIGYLRETGDYNADRKEIQMSTVQKYMRQFALALDYMHNFARIIHRDIKPENILVDSTDTIKVADFGVGQILEQEYQQLTSTNIGTQAYFAPEVFESNKFLGRPLDIWAFGVTFYKIYFSKLPFSGKNLNELKLQITSKPLAFPALPPNTCPLFCDLIRSCLDKNPQTRINAKKLLEHPFLTDSGKLVLRNLDVVDINVNEKEIQKALTKRKKISNFVYIATNLKQKLSQARRSLQIKQVSELFQDQR